jgi:hypothetical protein
MNEQNHLYPCVHDIFVSFLPFIPTSNDTVASAGAGRIVNSKEDNTRSTPSLFYDLCL